MKASLLIHGEEVLLDGRWVITIKVYLVEKSKKFPEGIKAKFVFINAEEGYARLLVDNHQPYGFHIHTQLPYNKEYREPMKVRDHLEALDVFMGEVRRIIENEEA